MGAQQDQGDGDEEVVEGEVVGVEATVSEALVPLQVDVVLHEEGRDQDAIQQVQYSNDQEY